ncbi:hypothetical protein A2456_01065 [Candidatus Nomurabacteria bacterium RIFOXYC2_FULL_36_19]|uniref:DUF11 domain-containing protein n=2 Tax=Candidatus Nomuraibacteriota TaxID=1752729 RepID=A0A1F6YRA6_9BACT|nr:MAG: hypothetical protein A2192_02350 [Candidatus Nomurabacteria bacterium RIFOXYA1_FULL_35_17]OGJ08909.1 MAG: hypothetical protein A2456_01065 [Candidatus Nomurabacteria bacterium RIFOXYC2_FULL_36_19]OGJ14470.1 MAG: hypothetical protein A2554_01375 [Candidatus Nomurabacteria bacterium RIFOXYD2_FULL_35_12]
MLQNDGNKLNRIEELKSKLFSKNYQTKIEHRDGFSHLNKNNIPDVWDNGEKVGSSSFYNRDNFFMKTPVFKKFFVFSLSFFVLTLIYASYVFFAGGNTVSNDNIDISILGNNFTAGGEELSLVVGITNKNNSSLDLADLIIKYPKNGSGNFDSSAEIESNRISLGTIPAGSVRNENIKLVLFGEQGSLIPIKISIEYRVEGSNAIFVKEKPYEVTINSTPLNLSVEAPDTVSPNQDITFNVKATLNATKPVSKILLKFDYPVGFQFKSSVPAPSLGNNIWSLGDLAPGTERNISVTGKMVDVSDGEEKSFHISSGSQSSSDKSTIDVVFNSLSHSVVIKKPFIEAKLFVNGVYQREYATNTKTPIQGEIIWTNNLDTKVNDLVIQAKISGNAVDRRTINAQQGFYDSSLDIITWDKNSKTEFSEVNPGDSGSVSFSVSSFSLVSASGGMISDPVININVSISGKQLLSGYATTNLNNYDSAIVRIISDVGFANKALYYSGPFANTGPIPPKVGAETSYTIVWSLSNTANNISKAIIRSSVPSWMKFVGTVSPSSEDLTYNPSTKEIVWNVGRITKGAGITGLVRSVSFQVVFTPSLSQIRTTPIIINDAVLTGHDDFANVDVRVNKSALRTQLDNDSSFPPAGGVVVE